MSELKIVKVAVENTVLSFDGLFDYGVPPELERFALAGCRVLVPFGRANVKKIGIIFEFSDRADVSGVKNISAVVDSSPIMGEKQIELAKWLSSVTFCTLYEAARIQLPSGMNLKLVKCYQPSQNSSENTFSKLNDEEARIFGEIISSSKPVPREKILERFGYVDDRAFESLISKNLICEVDNVKMSVGDKTLKSVRLTPDFSEKIKLTSKQQAVVSLLCDVGEATVRDVCYFTGITPAVVSALVKKGAAQFFDSEVLRFDIPPDEEKTDISEMALSEDQKKVYSGLKMLTESGKPQAALLYGITGSGKTQVFLRLIGDVIKSGRQAIVLVPEISLTPQTVKQFYKYFGSSVAVMHSGLSLGERFDRFKKIKSGEISVVVGTRSAVFAPLSNVGIVVIDEEQEASYKSESSPRYHAREVAKYICSKNNALLLLASATPCVDSYYFAKMGRYKLFSLSKRYGDAFLPEVTIVDMSQRDLLQRESCFSSSILGEIKENLSRGEQTILLYNRRGYHSVAVCGDCKKVITCPNCSIALTYHKKNNRLMCHYCGYSREIDTRCPVCNSSRLFYKGCGTQRVEDELEMLFPDARVLRMDLDNSNGKSAHRRQFDAFEQGEYDILVGTQMVAKGLNFPNVTLVGVLNADQALYSNDFRAYERAFSLITQVVGRSGRGKKAGRAIIQTSTPQNPVISFAAQQNFPEFFEQEISVRKALLYPPFCDLCVVGFVSQNHTLAKKGSEEFVSMIKQYAPEEKGIPLRVLGPSPMNVVKILGKYRYRLIIKCKNNRQFRQFMSELLKEFQKKHKSKDITVYADLNDVGNL